MASPTSALPSPRLSINGSQHLRVMLDKAASNIPGCFLVVASANEVLFDGQSGPYDVLLGEESPSVTADTIIWNSSATRFVVSLAYLQLVDRGLVSLDTPMSKFSPELEDISRQILRGFDTNGQPVFEPAKGEITLRTMLNGVSGFVTELSPTVKQWKAWSDKGKGFVNSCKVENLIYTPPCAEPGERFHYGTSIDWLSFIFPRISNQDLESYLQANIFGPLGISTASFFPFESDLAELVMPLHYLRTTADGKNQFETWSGQEPNHLLPTRRADIEYPTGGSGLYSRAADFTSLLQNVLKGYLHQVASIPTPDDFVSLLSPEIYKAALSPDLSATQVAGLADFMNSYFNLSADEGDTLIGAEDVNVNLANLPMYVGKERKGGWGRRPGSAGWGGAAGTDFYLDPTTGIIVFFSTQMLPGSGPLLKGLKKSLEKAVYEALEMN